jgi:hypothetical protein
LIVCEEVLIQSCYFIILGCDEKLPIQRPFVKPMSAAPVHYIFDDTVSEAV